MSMMEDLSGYNCDGTVLRRMQLRMLDMLVEVDKIFRKNVIPYWLEYGTLLGAIRHKGFIPWDDDIDICILRKDYKRARKALTQCLPENMAFQDTSSDRYAFFSYARIRDRRSYCYYPDFTKLKEQGIWIDIFIMDTTPSRLAKNVVDVLYRRVYHEIHHFGDVAYKSVIKKIACRIIAYALFPISYTTYRMSIFLGKLTGSRWLCVYATKGRCYTYRSKYIFPVDEVEFEGHRFLAPRDSDAHLREVYGNYMLIPPIEGRKHTINLETVKFYE